METRGLGDIDVLDIDEDDFNSFFEEIGSDNLEQSYYFDKKSGEEKHTETRRGIGNYTNVKEPNSVDYLPQILEIV